MAEYRLTRRADADLQEIARYGIETFGIEQTLRYRDGIKACLVRIAGAPLQFPRIDDVRPGYRRGVHGNHAIYYRTDGDRAHPRAPGSSDGAPQGMTRFEGHRPISLSSNRLDLSRDLI